MTLDERKRQLNLIAFPRGDTAAGFGEKGELVSREKKGSWKLEVKGGGVDSFRLQASLATLKNGFKPCRVEVDGKRLGDGRWDYEKKTDALEVRFKGSSPELTASGEGC